MAGLNHPAERRQYSSEQEQVVQPGAVLPVPQTVLRAGISHFKGHLWNKAESGAGNMQLVWNELQQGHKDSAEPPVWLLM